MAIKAKAHPEKRLFISLLTRDISLVDAFLDLIDNSVNAALRSSGFEGKTSKQYLDLLNAPGKPAYDINIVFNESTVSITDNCGGIDTATAQNSIFVFGAGSEDSHKEDRLSVYGIGLKRAMFKLGDQIDIVSEHANGGFELHLNVPKWETLKQTPWHFDIEARPKSKKGGTELRVTKLASATITRMNNPVFLTDLQTRIARTYSFFLGRIVRISVNGEQITGEEAEISEFQAAESFDLDGVSVAITAGISVPEDGRFFAERAGWNIYCNGRAVISFDRGPLTGWGVDGYLPSFQPKHRPFVGIVFFTSDIPERLPWTTTKLGVNPDNIVWQRAVQRMADVGRQITRFLDNRYSEEGTSISMDDLAESATTSHRVAATLTTKAKTFVQPRLKSPTQPSIQYKVDRKQLAAVKEAIGQPWMSNGDAGKYTFDYFYENEVGGA